MSYFVLSGFCSNKRQALPLIVIYELAQEADGISTMRSGFSGLFLQPLTRSPRYIFVLRGSS